MIKVVRQLGSHTMLNLKCSCGACSAVKWEQLKGHHTTYKPAGRSHPDFALPNPLGAMAGQVLVDDVLCAEALIGIGSGMVGNGVDGLGHVAVWLGLPHEDLAPSCSDELNKVVLWMVFEDSSQIEVASIEQLWQQLFSVAPASLWPRRDLVLLFLLPPPALQTCLHPFKF